MQLAPKAVQKNQRVGAFSVMKGAISNPLSVPPIHTVPTGSKKAAASFFINLYTNETTKAPKGLPEKA